MTLEYALFKLELSWGVCVCVCVSLHMWRPSKCVELYHVSTNTCCKSNTSCFNWYFQKFFGGGGVTLALRNNSSLGEGKTHPNCPALEMTAIWGWGEQKERNWDQGVERDTESISVNFWGRVKIKKERFHFALMERAWKSWERKGSSRNPGAEDPQRPKTLNAWDFSEILPGECICHRHPRESTFALEKKSHCGTVPRETSEGSHLCLDKVQA